MVHKGTIEAARRGLILRDEDGVCWRLTFADDQVPELIGGSVSVRGRIVEMDRIEVEYYEPLP